MSITIRLATINDAERVADLSRTTFREAFSAAFSKVNMDKFLSEQFTKGRLMLEVGRPENIFLLAYYKQQVEGYLKLRDFVKPERLRNEPCLEIARLYVLTDMTGKGVGTQLMENAEDIAGELHKMFLWLGVWEKNENALRFYQRFGFEKFSICEFHLGDDVQNNLLMMKILPDESSEQV